MSGSIVCKRCGASTPKTNYAASFCPPCGVIVYGAPLGRVAAAAAVTAARGDELLAVAGLAVEPYRSKLEARYAEQLDADRLGGLVAKWSYESLKLRLAVRTFYTPDFFVVTVERRIELHEVKATWAAEHQEDARVKLKVAAALFPEFRFFAITPAAGGGGGWDREAF